MSADNSRDTQFQERKFRKNGLKCPWHWQQVLSIVYYIQNLTAISYIMMPLFGLHLPYIYAPVLFLYIIILCLVFYFSFKASNSDPTDSVHYMELEAIKRNETFDATDYPLYCNVCETSVTQRAKHCGVCNRCVEVFDHHCRWLNNCVGKNNYMYFYRLIQLCALQALVFTISAILGLFLLNLSFEHTQKRWQKLHQYSLSQWRLNLSLSVFLACNIGALYFTGELILFHMKLQKQGITTYEYLVLLQEQKTGQKKISKVIKQKDLDLDQIKQGPGDEEVDEKKQQQQKQNQDIDVVIELDHEKLEEKLEGKQTKEKSDEQPQKIQEINGSLNYVEKKKGSNIALAFCCCRKKNKEQSKEEDQLDGQIDFKPDIYNMSPRSRAGSLTKVQALEKTEKADPCESQRSRTPNKDHTVGTMASPSKQDEEEKKSEISEHEMDFQVQQFYQNQQRSRSKVSSFATNEENDEVLSSSVNFKELPVFNSIIALSSSNMKKHVSRPRSRGYSARGRDSTPMKQQSLFANTAKKSINQQHQKHPGEMLDHFDTIGGNSSVDGGSEMKKNTDRAQNELQMEDVL